MNTKSGNSTNVYIRKFNIVKIGIRLYVFISKIKKGNQDSE